MDQQTPQPAGTENAENSENFVCSCCGTVAEGTPPTWTCSVEGGVRRYFCDSCARENLRAIEGRLDSPWW